MKEDIPEEIKPFWISEFNKSCEIDNIKIYFSTDDYNYINNIKTRINEIQTFFKEEYKIPELPRVYLFIYSNLDLMSQVFGRTIKSANQCYVPVHSENGYLITFTRLVEKKYLMQTLIHEFSHVVFGSITGNKDIGGFKQKLPLWLDEGMALYFDKEFRTDFPSVRSKRIELLIPHFKNILITDMYTYFNRLDKNEFGPIGNAHYAYSYFAVEYLISLFSESLVIDFIKNLKDSHFDSVFNDYFGLPIEEFGLKVKSHLKDLI